MKPDTKIKWKRNGEFPSLGDKQRELEVVNELVNLVKIGDKPKVIESTCQAVPKDREKKTPN